MASEQAIVHWRPQGWNGGVQCLATSRAATWPATAEPSKVTCRKCRYAIDGSHPRRGPRRFTAEEAERLKRDALIALRRQIRTAGVPAVAGGTFAMGYKRAMEEFEEAIGRALQEATDAR